MVILPLVYKTIPNTIPAFVDIWGNPIVSMEKSYLSIFRLPIMGILLSFICIVMYKIKYDTAHQKPHKMVWQTIAFISSLKMGITSLEPIFYEKTETIQYFRITVFVLVLTGILLLLYSLLRMYKNKISITEYKINIHKNKIVIIGILFLYIVHPLKKY